MLFPYLLKVSLLLAILTLGYRWMVQFETFSKLNRILLWLNVVAAWTLPLIPMPNWGPVKIQTEFHQTIPKIAAAAPVVKRQIAPYNPAPKVINRQNLNVVHFGELLLALYLSGVLVLGGYFLFQVGRLGHILTKSLVTKTSKKVIFARNKHITSPFSFFKWIVINPEQYDSRELQHIVAHETEHALQWHSVDLLISEIQRIVLWFNPFAWFHQKLVQANLEYLADKAVLEGGFEKKQYQYSLLNAVLQTREMPLTTSFAQSLLKKRIKMMNKKPSHYLAWSKYGLIVVMLYFSSAFVAPYSIKPAQIAHPVSLPVVKTFVRDNQKVSITVAPETETADQDALPVIEKKKSMDPVDSAQISSSKWIIKKNATLYWAISPLATLDDINEIRKEIRNSGAEMNINSLEYDPYQEFISRITVQIHVKTGGSAQGSDGTDKFTPIEGESGYFSSAGSLGTGGVPETLERMLKADYEKALTIAKEKESLYFEYRLMQTVSNSGGSSSHTLEVSELKGKNAESIYNSDGIGISPDNYLKLSSEYRNSELYLDAKSITFTDLISLPINRVKSLRIIRDSKGKKFLLVYTIR